MVDPVQIEADTLRGLFISAVRYALGRKSYVTGETCGWVRSYAHALDANTIKVITRDIDIQDQHSYSGMWDRETWMELRGWLAGLAAPPPTAGEPR